MTLIQEGALATTDSKVPTTFDRAFDRDAPDPDAPVCGNDRETKEGRCTAELACPTELTDNHIYYVLRNFTRRPPKLSRMCT